MTTRRTSKARRAQSSSLTVGDAAVTARCALGRDVFAAFGTPHSVLDALLNADVSGVFDDAVSQQGNAVLGQMAGMLAHEVGDHIADLVEGAVRPDPRLVGALSRLGYLHSRGRD